MVCFPSTLRLLVVHRVVAGDITDCETTTYSIIMHGKKWFYSELRNTGSLELNQTNVSCHCSTVTMPIELSSCAISNIKILTIHCGSLTETYVEMHLGSEVMSAFAFSLATNVHFHHHWGYRCTQRF